MKTIICSRCGEELPAEDFYNSSRIKSGKMSHCKKCQKKYMDNRRFKISVQTKVCTQCGKTLPNSAFYTDPSQKSGLRPNCKECQKEYNKLHPRDKKLKALYDIKIRDHLRSWLQEYKRGEKCFFCGESEPVALDFHHKKASDKTGKIASMKNYKDITEEIKKCVVVCANCHRKLHAGVLKYQFGG